MNRFPLLSLLLLVSNTACSVAAPASLPDCERDFALLERTARGRREEIVVRESEAVRRQSGARRKEERTLEWHAFGRPFVVDAFRLLPDGDVPDGAADAGKVGWSGVVRGAAATRVVLWRWPSGAWEADILIDQSQYTLKPPCGPDRFRNGKPVSTIFVEDWPEEPEL